MELLRDYVIEERSEIMANGIRLAAIGEVERLPPFVAEPLAELMADSAGNSDMVLTLALSYGGRESICRAVTELIASGATGPVTEQKLESFLPTAGLPPLDLLIRTSGEVRISNFLLWEAAYAELVFSDALWPEFRREQLFEAIDTYNRRQRRFGLTGEQVESGGDLAP
jgi:undecaprenyl diphosphate synthase